MADDGSLMPPVHLNQLGFDPTLPLKIRRDKFDGENVVFEKVLGVLASPAAAGAKVMVVLGDYQKLCSSRDLAIQSLYFRRHLCRYPSPTKVLVPPTVPVDGLDGALKFMESNGVEITIWNLSPIFCAAARLEIADLQRRLEIYVKAVSKLNDSYFLQCWEMCRRAPASVQLRAEMMSRAAERFMYLTDEPEWIRMNSHLVRRLLLRPELKVYSPVNLFEAALTWIAGNPSADQPDVDRILGAVPFKRMSPVDRMQCLAKAAEMQLTSVVAPRIAQASWHQTCINNGHPSQSDLPFSEQVTNATDCVNDIFLPTEDKAGAAGATLSQVTFAIQKNNEGNETVESTSVNSERKSAPAPIEITEQIRRESTTGRGGPIRFVYSTEATKNCEDGHKCVYKDQIVMNRKINSADTRRG